MDSQIQTQILYSLQSHEEKDNDGQSNAIDEIAIWTEVQDGSGKYLRATPHYPKVGAWYDWVTVHFTREENGQEYYLPAKCLLFYLDRHGEPSALIHSVGWDPLPDKTNSLLFQEWQKEYTAGYSAVLKVPLSSIQHGILVFERFPLQETPLNPNRIQNREEIKRDRIVVVHPRTTWASKFFSWCRESI